jgi:hypothetical protein
MERPYPSTEFSSAAGAGRVWVGGGASEASNMKECSSAAEEGKRGGLEGARAKRAQRRSILLRQKWASEGGWRGTSEASATKECPSAAEAGKRGNCRGETPRTPPRPARSAARVLGRPRARPPVCSVAHAARLHANYYVAVCLARALQEPLVGDFQDLRVEVWCDEPICHFQYAAEWVCTDGPEAVVPLDEPPQGAPPCVSSVLPLEIR